MRSRAAERPGDAVDAADDDAADVRDASSTSTAASSASLAWIENKIHWLGHSASVTNRTQ